MAVAKLSKLITLFTATLQVKNEIVRRVIPVGLIKYEVSNMYNIK